MKLRTTLALLAASTLITACSGLFDKDNLPTPSPLVNFQAEIAPQKLWAVQTGAKSGNQYLRLSPAQTTSAIYTISDTGFVTAVNKADGQIKWQVNLHHAYEAGLAASEADIIAVSRTGLVSALDANNGKVIWTHQLMGEVLAKPAVNLSTAIVKTTDGRIIALSVADGSEVWQFHQSEPQMILRAGSTPVLAGQYAFVGFANGKLAKLNLKNGNLSWLSIVAQPEGAFTIQRMVDIDANPIIDNQRIYVATYQGKIARLQWTTGLANWHQNISSYTGMVVSNHRLYITDAASNVWCFNANNGEILWQQKQLAARGLTAPVAIQNYLVIGDAEGYLHWLAAKDGKTVARQSLGGAIYATPLVEGNTVYVINNQGYLAAYRLR